MDARQNFTDIEYSLRKETGRRAELLEKLDELLPWEEMEAKIVPIYPEGKRGRPVKPIPVMLRIFILQEVFGMNAPSVEDAVYDSYAFRRFVGINFMEEQAPDANTIYKFRRLLKSSGLAEEFDAVLHESIKGAALKLIPGKISEPRLQKRTSARKSKAKTKSKAKSRKPAKA